MKGKFSQIIYYNVYRSHITGSTSRYLHQIEFYHKS